jgi:hypothetical protein
MSIVRKQERIVCAAIKYSNGITLVGSRHFSPAMIVQYKKYKEHGIEFIKNGCVQGFINQWDEFKTREEAWKIAEAAGQILYRCGGDTINGGKLFSENLY